MCQELVSLRNMIKEFAINFIILKNWLSWFFLSSKHWNWNNFLSKLIRTTKPNTFGIYIYIFKAVDDFLIWKMSQLAINHAYNRFFFYVCVQCVLNFWKKWYTLFQNLLSEEKMVSIIWVLDSVSVGTQVWVRHKITQVKEGWRSLLLLSLSKSNWRHWPVCISLCEGAGTPPYPCPKTQYLQVSPVFILLLPRAPGCCMQQSSLFFIQQCQASCHGTVSASQACLQFPTVPAVIWKSMTANEWMWLYYSLMLQI